MTGKKAAAAIGAAGMLVSLWLWFASGTIEEARAETLDFAPRLSGAPAPETELTALGRMLFFDPRLSRGDTTSCATCHAPEKGFTDGVPKAVGRNGKVLARRTPPVINLAPRAPYFWDGRAKTMEEQALMPISNLDEMGQDLDALVPKLLEIPEYAARLHRCFGTSVTKECLGVAIAAFERTLTSSDASFDRYLRGDPSALSARARRGMQVFAGKARCIKCHGGPDLTDNGFHNVGVPGDDPGRFRIVPVAAMKGAFKTPTLRDVSRRAPYFHDGSALSLRLVVDHYDRGGVAKENLDPEIRPLGLEEAEKEGLVEFLESLSGKTPEFHPVRLTSLGRHIVVPKTLKELMLACKSLFDSADESARSRRSQEGSAVVFRRSEQLLNLVECIPDLGLQRVLESQKSRFVQNVGEVMVEIKNVQQAALDNRWDELAHGFGRVGRRCDACHEAFRPKSVLR